MAKVELRAHTRTVCGTGVSPVIHRRDGGATRVPECALEVRRYPWFLATLVLVFVTPSSLPAQVPNGPRDAPSATAQADDSRTASQPSEEARAAPPSARQKTDPRVARWVRALFWSVVLLVVLIFAAIAIVVFSRRYRRYLLRGRQAPTPSDDLWTMHRLPPEALSDLEPPPEDK